MGAEEPSVDMLRSVQVTHVTMRVGVGFLLWGVDMGGVDVTAAGVGVRAIGVRAIGVRAVCVRRSVGVVTMAGVSVVLTSLVGVTSSAGGEEVRSYQHDGNRRAGLEQLSAGELTASYFAVVVRALSPAHG